MEQFPNIIHDISVMGGKACIKGTRVTVSMILLLIGDGVSVNEILKEYPYLSQEDITQSLRYAAWNTGAVESVIAIA